MPRVRPRWALTAALTSAVLFLIVWLASSRGWATELFEFHAPHRAVRSRAVLEQPLAESVRAAREQSSPRGISELIEFALDQTAQHLHFGLGHRTTLAFSPSEREGNCIEYSHLFAKIFEAGAEASGVRATSYVVNSGRARLMGMAIPRRGWSDHDWVLVIERDAAGAELARHFIDPSFYDTALGWDIRRSVIGPVSVPR
jgi:hypothetical protein